MAKSAATLLCLVADELVLGDVGELGPLDAQCDERQQADFPLNTSRLALADRRDKRPHSHNARLSDLAPTGLGPPSARKVRSGQSCQRKSGLDAFALPCPRPGPARNPANETHNGRPTSRRSSRLVMTTPASRPFERLLCEPGR